MYILPNTVCSRFFFLCRPFLVFIEFVTVLFLFYVLTCFGCEACGILATLPGIKPTPPALEGEVFTTGPGKSPPKYYKLSLDYICSTT